MKFETNELKQHGNEYVESKVKALTELNRPTHSVEIFMFLSPCKVNFHPKKCPDLYFNELLHVAYIFCFITISEWQVKDIHFNLKMSGMHFKRYIFPVFNEVVFLFERNTHLWCGYYAGDNWYLISDGSCISRSSLKKMSRIAFEKLLASLAQRQDVTFLLHNENHLLSYNVS